MYYMKEKIFVFRKYKRKQGKKNVRHPKLIVESKKDEYGFMGLTSSNKTGHHKNYKLIKNPQKNNNKTSYLRKSIEYDKKKMFSDILDEYNLSKEDKKYVINYVNKHKKKK